MKKSAFIMVFFFLGIFALIKNMYIVPTAEVIEKKESTKPVITILAGQSTSDAGTTEMIQEVLEEKFPDVEFEWICVNWGGENFSLRITGKYMNGNAPDIIIGKGQDALNYAKRGKLLPLDEACGVKMSDTEKDSLRMDGKLYGLPYTVWYQGVLYNKDIFFRESLQVPETLEELNTVVQKLEERGITPFAGHFLQGWPIANMTMQFMLNDILRTDLTWGERFRDGTEGFCGNEAVEPCFMNIRYILEHSWKDALQLEQYECDERFGRGDAAMYMTGFWSVQNIAQNENGPETGIFPYPNQTEDAGLIKEINLTFMKSAYTKQSELVDQILLELGTNENLAKKIADFTKGKSVMTGVESEMPGGILDSIQSYEVQNRITAAESGNIQLEWSFQSILSDQTLTWLRGESKLEDVLRFADENVKESRIAD